MAELEHGVPYRSMLLRIWPKDQPPPTEAQILERSKHIVELNDPLAHAALTRRRHDLVVTDAQMAAVSVPTLAIIGSADGGLKGVNDLKKILPPLKVVVVEGAVHHDADNPQRDTVSRPEFVSAIRQFIAEGTVRAGGAPVGNR